MESGNGMMHAVPCSFQKDALLDELKHEFKESPVQDVKASLLQEVEEQVYERIYKNLFQAIQENMVQMLQEKANEDDADDTQTEPEGAHHSRCR